MNVNVSRHMRHLSLPSTQGLTGVTVAAYPNQTMDYIENNIGIKHLMCFKQQSIKTESSKNRNKIKSGTSGTTFSPTPFRAYRNREEKRGNPGLSPYKRLKIGGREKHSSALAWLRQTAKLMVQLSYN